MQDISVGLAELCQPQLSACPDACFEAPCLPTALLPSRILRWKELDADSAHATLVSHDWTLLGAIVLAQAFATLAHSALGGAAQAVLGESGCFSMFHHVLMHDLGQPASARLCPHRTGRSWTLPLHTPPW